MEKTLDGPERKTGKLILRPSEGTEPGMDDYLPGHTGEGPLAVVDLHFLKICKLRVAHINFRERVK